MDLKTFIGNELIDAMKIKAAQFYSPGYIQF